MKARVRVALTDDSGRPFMGIGLVWLIDRIGRFGSIRRAAQDMGMSYVKALRILNRLERKLGRGILIRRRGGSARGGAELTPFAREFVGNFKAYHHLVEDYALKEYATMFGKGRRRRGRKRTPS